MPNTAPALTLVLLLPLAACSDDGPSSMETDVTGSSTTAPTTTEATVDSTATSENSSSSDSGSESSTTAPMPCVSDEECTNAGAPFCGTTGECGTCDGTADPDGACAGVDAMLPLCVGDTCVACTEANPTVCDEQLLLCDGGSNSCVPCDAHEQCESGACQLAVGTCFPLEAVHVDGDGGQQYATVSAAVNAISPGGIGVIVVHEIDGDNPYTGTVLIDGDKTIALLAAPGESPILQGTGGNPGVNVTSAGTILYVDGLTVQLSDGVGLRVDDAFAWVDRSRIVRNTAGGIRAQNGAELTVRNSFVNGDSDLIALEVIGSTADVLYTTVGGGFGSATALTCDLGATVTARNSLFVTRADINEVACNGIIERSAAESSLGGTNVTLGDMDTAWFTGFGTGGFGLTDMHPIAIDTAARWNTGDPRTDIDGEPRPDVNDTPDYAGADVPAG